MKCCNHRADTGADGAIADKPKKANPFGDAKAVNTAEADKRAEERLAREERCPAPPLCAWTAASYVGVGP